MHASGARQWTHTTGLQIQSRPHPTRWDLRVEPRSRLLIFMQLMMPRIHPDIGIQGLLADLNSWIQAIDLDPSRRMVDIIAAWLTAHGKTGIYVCTITDPQHPHIVVRPEGFQGRAVQVSLPPALIDRLQADIDALWRLWPSPGRIDDVLVWMPSDAPPTYARAFRVQLPTTAHARMEILARPPPELRAISWPRPSV